jgi:hypothetical protein
MDQRLTQGITGWAGIVSFLISVIVGVLFFTYSGAPPVENVLMRDFLNLFVTVAFIVFLTGFQYCAVQTKHGYEWIGTLVLAFGLAFIIVTLVGQALESASVLGQTLPTDPTLVGSGAEGAIVIYGPIARMLTAAFLVSAGILIFGTRAVRSWIGWMALGVAAFHFALVPTYFSGFEPSRFYSINGLGIPTAGGLLLVWILITSVALLVKRRSLPRR